MTINPQFNHSLNSPIQSAQTSISEQAILYNKLLQKTREVQTLSQQNQSLQQQISESQKIFSTAAYELDEAKKLAHQLLISNNMPTLDLQTAAEYIQELADLIAAQQAQLNQSSKPQTVIPPSPIRSPNNQNNQEIVELSVQKEHYRLKIEQLQKANADLTRKLKTAESESALKHKNQLQLFQAQIAQLQKQSAAQDNDTAEELGFQLQAAVEQNQLWQKRYELLGGQNAAQQSELAKFNAEKGPLLQAVEEGKETISQLTANLQEQRALFDELREQFRDTQQQALANEDAQLQKINDLNNQILTLQSQSDLAGTGIKQCNIQDTSIYQSALDEIKCKQGTIDTLKRLLDSKTDEINKLRLEQFDQNKRNKLDLQKQLQNVLQIDKEKQQYVQKGKDAQKDLNNNKEEIARLNNILTSTQNLVRTLQTKVLLLSDQNEELICKEADTQLTCENQLEEIKQLKLGTEQQLILQPQILQQSVVQDEELTQLKDDYDFVKQQNELLQRYIADLEVSRLQTKTLTGSTVNSSPSDYQNLMKKYITTKLQVSDINSQLQLNEQQIIKAQSVLQQILTIIQKKSSIPDSFEQLIVALQNDCMILQNYLNKNGITDILSMMAKQFGI